MLSHFGISFSAYPLLAQSHLPQRGLERTPPAWLSGQLWRLFGIGSAFVLGEATYLVGDGYASQLTRI
jgi:hypothetical protein